MQPSPTKKTEAPNAVVVLPWHPNFRNYERLPDIKVIRTTFFVNTVAVVLTLLLGAWVASREYHLFTLSGQNLEAQKLIEEKRKPSDQAVQLYKQFQDEERRFNEVSAFTKSRHLVSPLLFHLGQTLPKSVALNYFDFREKLLTIRGIVRGSADQAAGRASSYEAKLKKDDFLKAYAESVSLTNATRSTTDERLSFEIQIKIKAPSK